MKEDIWASTPAIFPADFFSLESDIPKIKNPKTLPKKIERFYLPDTSDLLNEESFAKVAVLWHETGLFGFIEVAQGFEEARYPEVKEGDSIEIFVDTRNMKNAGYATRFCHHFVFLPKAVNGISCKELTRFRSEDKHVVLDKIDAEMKTEFFKHSYTLQFFLPVDSLCGYEPGSCPALGFTYRINRCKGRPQHYSVSSLYYSMEQQPSLWATLNLKQETI